MRKPPKLLPALLAPVLLAACASQRDFPSLAPRAVERDMAGTPAPPCMPPGSQSAAAARAPAAPVPAAVPSDPVLAARVTALVEQGRRGQSAFASALPAAQASSRRAGAQASEAWIAAQQDISRLEAARALTVDALAELDSLVLARSSGATSAEDRDALLAAAEEVRRLAEAQQAEIDRLSAPLSRP